MGRNGVRRTGPSLHGEISGDVGRRLENKARSRLAREDLEFSGSKPTVERDCQRRRGRPQNRKEAAETSAFSMVKFGRATVWAPSAARHGSTLARSRWAR